MPIFVLSGTQVLGVLLGLAGLAYLAFALRSTRRFREQPWVLPGWQPKVSVLKPLHGTAPHLYECLRSFCEQDWSEYEVIFGFHTDSDPAIDVVQQLEQGGLDLDASLKLWERGEELARRCEEHLAGARKRVEDALAPKDEDDS